MKTKDRFENTVTLTLLSRIISLTEASCNLLSVKTNPNGETLVPQFIQDQVKALHSCALSTFEACNEYAGVEEERQTSELGLEVYEDENTIGDENKSEEEKDEDSKFIYVLLSSTKEVFEFPYENAIGTIRSKLGEQLNTKPSELKLKYKSNVLNHDQMKCNTLDIPPESTLKLILLSETRNLLRQYEEKYEIFRDVPLDDSPRVRLQRGLDWKEAMTPKAGFKNVKGVQVTQQSGKPQILRSTRFRKNVLDPNRPKLTIPSDGSSSPVFRRLIEHHEAYNSPKRKKTGIYSSSSSNNSSPQSFRSRSKSKSKLLEVGGTLSVPLSPKSWDSKAFAQSQKEADGFGVGSESHQLINAVDGEGSRLVAYSSSRISS
eukprot:g2932.t1